MNFVVSRVTEAGWVALIAAVMAVIFVTQPQLDLAVSGLFYADGQWTTWRDSLFVQILYRGVPPLGQGILLALAVLFGLSFLRRFASLEPRRLGCAFLLASALIGQGLLVDQGLKNHLGRARPSQITEFGGDKRFTPAFAVSDQCSKNCSFASGHVAASAFLMGFGWLGTRRQHRRWLVASLLGAATMGLVRILQGGHFLSDVVFAWFATYLSFWLSAWLFRKFGWLPGEIRASEAVDR